MKAKLVIALSVLFVTVMVQNASAVTATWSGQYTTVTYSKPDIYSATVSWTPLSPSLVYAYQVKVIGGSDVSFDSGVIYTTSCTINWMYPVERNVSIEITAYGYSGTQIIARVFYENGTLGEGCTKSLGTVSCKLTTYRDSKNNRWYSKFVITHQDASESGSNHPGFDIEIADAETILSANTTRELIYYIPDGVYTIYIKPKSCTTGRVSHCLVAGFIVETDSSVTNQDLTFTTVSN